MQFIPAIDLKDGACVRLKQGEMDQATAFFDDPVEAARRWANAGAERLHIVDLNGAFEGRPVHAEIISRIIKAVPQVAVQVGGGLREEKAIEDYLAAGVKKIILGTKAIREPDFLESCASCFPNTLLYGLDVRQGQVAVSGWKETSSYSAKDLISAATHLPLAGVVYTDIEKDGMLAGVNVQATLETASVSPFPVIASGGISTLDDLTRLLEAQKSTGVALEGVISGRALYEGTLDCKEAVALCRTFADTT